MHVVWADYSADYDIDWELRNYKENYYMVEQFVYLPRVEIGLLDYGYPYSPASLMHYRAL